MLSQTHKRLIFETQIKKFKWNLRAVPVPPVKVQVNEQALLYIKYDSLYACLYSMWIKV